MISLKTGEALQELLLEVCHIWSWTFDYDFHLIGTNSISPNLFTKVMLEEKHMRVLSESRPGDKPLILSNTMGLMFSAVFGEKRIWFLGPVYTVEVNERDIEKLLIPYHLRPGTAAALIDNLRQVPMVSSSGLLEKTLMLHRLVTGELTDISDLRYHVSGEREETKTDLPKPRHAPLLAEKQLLENVRTGNLEYRTALSQAASVFDRLLPGMRKMVDGNPQASALSVEQLVRYTRNPRAEEIIAALNEALNALNTPENAISPSERRMIEAFRRIDAADRAGKQREISHRQEAICPGKPWLDTEGKRIQAHGGAVWYENGTYYWYGENKEHTDGKNGIWTWGLKVYSSKDLMNWEDQGFLIPPVLDDPNSALFPTKRVDRPHILRCPATGKYVCWIKLSGPEAAFTIWQADRFSGPYTMVENLYNPGGHKAGDFDLISDPGTGKGYLYFDADHSAMMCMELSGDYLHAEKEAAQSYAGLNPPFTREAPALFEKDGKKYMLTSGMTGYVPNKSDSAVCDSWDGEFVSLGDPHEEDASCASFNSQISKIFRVEGTDTLIAMADRWLPQQKVDARLADVFTRVIAGNYDREHYQATEEERREMYAANKLESADTSIADYVWLPIEWKNGRPVLRWRDAWTV